MSSLQIITTSDGSHSLFHEGLNETYHSRHGAVQESQHVFVLQGLRYCLEVTGKKELVIFEVGFGTGLNAWLTLQLMQSERVRTTYVAVEAYPVQKDVWTQLNYAPGDEAFRWLHEAAWDQPVVYNDWFTLHKIHRKLEELSLATLADVIYFDAFAPGKQPEMWTLSTLEKVCSMLAPMGVFVTYCAKGQLKRDLRKIGLQIETLPGPPGKKEMVRATKTAESIELLKLRPE